MSAVEMGQLLLVCASQIGPNGFLALAIGGMPSQGAVHVTLIPEWTPMLVTLAPSVTAHCWVSVS
jgi:hypothetical protein